MIGQQRLRRARPGASPPSNACTAGATCVREVAAVPARAARPASPVLQLVSGERAHELEQLEAAVVGLAADEAGLQQLVDLGADRPVGGDGLERRQR